MDIAKTIAERIIKKVDAERVRLKRIVSLETRNRIIREELAVEGYTDPDDITYVKLMNDVAMAAVKIREKEMERKTP